MAPKRNLDDLEYGEFSLGADHVIAKKSRLPPTPSEECRIKVLTQWYEYNKVVDSLQSDIDALETNEDNFNGVDATSPSDEEGETTSAKLEPESDINCVDEDMMDVDVEDEIESKPYDPTEGIYDAILEPKAKDGTMEVMRQRTLEIIQVLNSKRSIKYPSLWLRSLCQILHAVTFAAQNSPTNWELTATDMNDFGKIASVMEDIALWMPHWNKPNFPKKLLQEIDERFESEFGIVNLLEGVLPHFNLESCWKDRTQPAVYAHDVFFDDHVTDIRESVEFWNHDSELDMRT